MWGICTNNAFWEGDQLLIHMIQDRRSKKCKKFNPNALTKYSSKVTREIQILLQFSSSNANCN